MNVQKLMHNKILTNNKDTWAIYIYIICNSNKWEIYYYYISIFQKFKNSFNIDNNYLIITYILFKYEYGPLYF